MQPTYDEIKVNKLTMFIRGHLLKKGLNGYLFNITHDGISIASVRAVPFSFYPFGIDEHLRYQMAMDTIINELLNYGFR